MGCPVEICWPMVHIVACSSPLQYSTTKSGSSWGPTEYNSLTIDIAWFVLHWTFHGSVIPWDMRALSVFKDLAVFNLNVGPLVESNGILFIWYIASLSYGNTNELAYTT